MFFLLCNSCARVQLLGRLLSGMCEIELIYVNENIVLILQANCPGACNFFACGSSEFNFGTNGDFLVALMFAA